MGVRSRLVSVEQSLDRLWTDVMRLRKETEDLRGIRPKIRVPVVDSCGKPVKETKYGVSGPFGEYPDKYDSVHLSSYLAALEQALGVQVVLNSTDGIVEVYEREDSE